MLARRAARSPRARAASTSAGGAGCRAAGCAAGRPIQRARKTIVGAVVLVVALAALVAAASLAGGIARRWRRASPSSWRGCAEARSQLAIARPASYASRAVVRSARLSAREGMAEWDSTSVSRRAIGIRIGIEPDKTERDGAGRRLFAAPPEAGEICCPYGTGGYSARSAAEAVPICDRYVPLCPYSQPCCRYHAMVAAKPWRSGTAGRQPVRAMIGPGSHTQSLW